VSVAAAVSIVLIGWAALAIVLFGVGALLAALAGVSRPGHVSTYIWLGWSVTLAYLQIAQAFKPVDQWDQVVLGACGIAGVWHSRALLRPRRFSPSDAAAGVFVLAFAVYAARHGLVPPRDY